jgi:hypothetical protein
MILRAGFVHIMEEFHIANAAVRAKKLEPLAESCAKISCQKQNSN